MRVKNSVQTRARRKRILKSAEGYFGSKHLLFKTAKEQVLRSWRYSYIGRKQEKSNFRKLWIRRINAACHQNGISYSAFMGGLVKAGVLTKDGTGINRKMLSEIAIRDPEAFKALVEKAKAARA